MDCIHLSKDFLLVFNVPEIMCLVFECSPPRKSVSPSSNYHIPEGSWLMISLWTTCSFSFLCSARTISNPMKHFRIRLGPLMLKERSGDGSNSVPPLDPEPELGRIQMPGWDVGSSNGWGNTQKRCLSSGQAGKLRLLQWHMQQVDVFKGCVISWAVLVAEFSTA